jgi:hypothetical protein
LSVRDVEFCDYGLYERRTSLESEGIGNKRKQGRKQYGPSVSWPQGRFVIVHGWYFLVLVNNLIVD